MFLARRYPAALLILLTAGPLAPAADAYFGASALELAGHAGNYVEIPHHASLNPTAALTIEAWVRVTSPSECISLVGKGYTETYWLGLCGSELRSFLAGAGNEYDAGTVANDTWTHVAVAFDGATRRHFINGVEVGSESATSAPLPTNTQPLRIGSDADYDYPPIGWIDEVRLWDIARTEEEIRAAMSAPITTVQPGLVAAWGLDGDAGAAVGGNDGAVVGTVAFTPGLWLDLLGGRFRVTMTWESATDGGQAFPIPLTHNTGTFYFINPANYEVMIKAIDACALNGRFWIFIAGLTNVGAEITVTDVSTEAVRVYANPRGSAFQPVQDTNAFVTCP